MKYLLNSSLFSHLECLSGGGLVTRGGSGPSGTRAVLSHVYTKRGQPRPQQSRTALITVSTTKATDVNNDKITPVLLKQKSSYALKSSYFQFSTQS